MAENVTIFKIGKVVSLEDETGGDRIKVALLPEDSISTSVSEIAYAYPFLPKMIHVKPKVGEAVYVFTAVANNGYTQRFYIGPIISQQSHMNYDSFNYDATSINEGSLMSPDESPEMNPESNGAYPKDEDISIEGRKNAGVQITDNDVRVKAGVKVVNQVDDRDIHFNKKNPGYVLVRYYDNEQTTGNGEQYQSVATVVADKINLINSEEFKTTDAEELISETEMKKIIDKAHKLPYGDVLIEFLDLFRKALLTHVHPYPTLPPCVDAQLGIVQNYDLNKILSDTTKIS